MSAERIVAVGLLTQRELDLLGPSLAHVWPVEEAPYFAELLQAIDEADRQLMNSRNKHEAGGSRP